MKKNKVKKPIYKRVWFWLLVVVVLGSVGAALGDGEEKEPVVDNDKGQSEVVDIEESPEVVEPEEEKVPREYRNALKSAEGYLRAMHFSKEGLYNQLLYEEYPQDAASYAVDNIVVDWNEQALKTAESYLNLMSFSDSGLRDQLEYEGFSEEQIDYAINNLDD